MHCVIMKYVLEYLITSWYLLLALLCDLRQWYPNNINSARQATYHNISHFIVFTWFVCFFVVFLGSLLEKVGSKEILPPISSRSILVPRWMASRDAVKPWEEFPRFFHSQKTTVSNLLFMKIPEFDITNWGWKNAQPTPKIDETIKHLFDFAGTWTCCFHGWKLTETDGSLLTGATHGNLPPASALPLPSATLKVFPGRGYGGDMPVNRRCQC